MFHIVISTMPLTPQKFPIHLFRAYDIRGALSNLTPNVMESIAYAFANQLNLNHIDHIVLGHDARLAGTDYAQIMLHVLHAHQIDVTFLGCCSTPVMYFMAQQSQYQTGVMLTASHNPKTDFGVKWLWQNQPPTPDDIQAIARIAQPYYEAHSHFETHDLARREACEVVSTQSYLDHLCNDIVFDRPLTVVIDAMHGSAGQYAKQVFTQLGCTVVALRCEANGHFPDHAPDPSKEAHLTGLKAAVIEHAADLGIALDGDGDRLVVVDETARIISPDQLICLFAQMCLAQYPKHEVVFDVKCSSMVKQAIEALNGQAVMLRTGSTFLRQYLLQSQGNAVFGGEYAGHYVFNDGRGQGYDDGLYAALRLIEYFIQSTATQISDLLKDYPQRHFTEDTYIDLNGENITELFNYFKLQCQNTDATLTQIDGIRLDFSSGVGIIRASNTGAYLTVRFDAITAEDLIQIRQKFATLLHLRYPDIAVKILQAT